MGKVTVKSPLFDALCISPSEADASGTNVTNLTLQYLVGYVRHVLLHKPPEVFEAGLYDALGIAIIYWSTPFPYETVCGLSGEPSSQIERELLRDPTISHAIGCGITVECGKFFRWSSYTPRAIMLSPTYTRLEWIQQFTIPPRRSDGVASTHWVAPSTQEEFDACGAVGKFLSAYWYARDVANAVTNYKGAVPKRLLKSRDEHLVMARSAYAEAKRAATCSGQLTRILLQCKLP